MNPKSRWQQFRECDDSIPSSPFEACVFIQNARIHLYAYGYESIDARELLTEAHARINNSFFDKPEVAA